jgi:hypothetical protein
MLSASTPRRAPRMLAGTGTFERAAADTNAELGR